MRAPRFILIVILLAAAWTSRAGDVPEPTVDPVPDPTVDPVPEPTAAVLALTHPEDSGQETVKLAELIVEALGARAISPEELKKRLGGSNPTSLTENSAKSFQQRYENAFLQTYSFAYAEARRNLSELIADLDNLPPGPLRWELFVKAHIALGMALEGAKDKPAALQAYAAILRTRPEMQLSRRDYSSRTIKTWSQARERIDALPRGGLAIDSQPGGARILLDGVDIGKTPFLGAFAEGRYHVQLIHPDGAQAESWIDLGAGLRRLNPRLLREPELDLGQACPVLRLPSGQTGLPGRWWDWLGDRLGDAALILVERTCSQTGCEFMVRLVDPFSGHSKRYARLQRATEAQLSKTAAGLADYLTQGESSALLEAPGKRPADEPEAGQKTDRRAGHLVPRLSDPAAFADIQPWYRRWWPYAIGSAGLLGMAVGAQFGHAHFSAAADDALTEEGISEFRGLAKLYLGLAITGYCLAAASLVTGVVMDWTFERNEQGLSVFAGPEGALGLSWTRRF